MINVRRYVSTVTRFQAAGFGADGGVGAGGVYVATDGSLFVFVIEDVGGVLCIVAAAL